jgi:hypothetical protein
MFPQVGACNERKIDSGEAASEKHQGMSGTEHTFEVIPAVSAVFSSMTAPATGRFS